MTGNAVAPGRREATCVWCGTVFSPAGRRGPAARYCRRSHRQRAHEERRSDADRAELVALRGLVAGLTGLAAPVRPGPASRAGTGSTPTGSAPTGSASSGWVLVLTGPEGTSQLLGRYPSQATAELALRRRRQTYRGVCGARVADRLSWQVAPVEQP